MRIFAESELRNHLETLIVEMAREVHAENRNRLLNLNEKEYIAYLASRYCVEPLVLHLDQISISDEERLIPVQYFPRDFGPFSKESYPKQVITYHIPYSGETCLLHLRPSSGILWSTEVKIGREEVSFDIINWNNDPENINREAGSIIAKIELLADNLAKEVEQYNASLERRAWEFVRERKEEHLRQSNMVESLGVPLKRRESVSPTFAIPIQKKRAIIQKPSAPTTPYSPEPALSPDVYKEILRICRDAGVEIERHPSIYEGKGEEALRDYFLMVLAPHFESVTSETFNKKGKTDILIRHEGKNVFVAECKFWGGLKKHYETIDQTLRYLTWRDSKAAILYFVKNKQLDPVLQQIGSETSSHTCFVRRGEQPSEGWYNFHFHLFNDNTRGIELAVLCFHFPE